MPRKSKKKSTSLQIKPEVYRTIFGVLLIAIGIVTYISYFQSTGVVTNWVDSSLAQLFGGMKYLFPILLFVYGALLLKRPKERDYLVIRTIAVTMTFLIASGMYHLVRFAPGEPALEAARSAMGGGFTGYIIAQGGFALFGRVGGFVFGAALLSISVIVGLNIPLYLDNLFDGVKNNLLAIGQGGASVATREGGRVKQAALSLKNKGNQSGQVLDEDIERLVKRSKVDEVSAEEPTTDKSLQKPTPEQATQKEEPKTEEKQTFEEALFGAKEETKKEEEVQEAVKEAITQKEYSLPGMDLLEAKGKAVTISAAELKKNAQIIKQTLLNFGIEVEMGDVDVGPTVTRYMLRPNNGVKLSRITALQNDIALALAAQAIRIEAPIPGMSFVGIEIPNKNRGIVRLREVLEGSDFAKSDHVLPLALGKDVRNHPVMFPLEKMPHLLIAGATGAGKSMGLNAMILSLLYKNTPDNLRFIFVDPKRVELSTYNGIPHLLTPAIVQPEKALNALIWCVQEMERRYEKLAEVGTRNIFTYQEMRLQSLEDEEADPLEAMPFIVIVIDELADLMTTHKKEVEASIVRIAQMARAVGMHLILATQRPSTDVITGLIKANLPSRASYQVASQIDSRTILDMSGAEKLLGRGDMLFIGGDLAKPQRVQGPLVPEEEVKKVVDFWKSIAEAEYQDEITAADSPKGDFVGGGAFGASDDADPLFDEAKELVMSAGKASSSMLQRRLRVGYARAARILDELEMAGVVGPADGSKPRDVLVSFDEPAGDAEM